MFIWLLNYNFGCEYMLFSCRVTRISFNRRFLVLLLGPAKDFTIEFAFLSTYKHIQMKKKRFSNGCTEMIDNINIECVRLAWQSVSSAFFSQILIHIISGLEIENKCQGRIAHDAIVCFECAGFA